MCMRFQAYGIRVDHPERYKVYITQNQKFQFEEGVVKFDDPAETAEGRTSLTVSWEPAGEEEHGFAARYLSCVEDHYEKKMKKRYNLIEKRLLLEDGHETAFVHARVLSATHVLKPLGKSVVLELMQTARHCPDTKRIVLATVMAEASYFKEHRSELEEMLFSVGCHADCGTLQQNEPHGQCGSGEKAVSCSTADSIGQKRGCAA